MLRNADMIIRIYRDGEKRKVKIVDYRHVPKKIEFEIE
jgi:hypothetical protein